MPGREPLSESIRVSSAATLAGLVPHYLLFYLAGTPLWTDRIAEWMMARIPSPYAVSILDHLGSWAKPWAGTAGLATLGLIVSLSRLAASFVPKKLRLAVIGLIGAVFAFRLAWAVGYTSFAGSLAFWVPALAIAALIRPKPQQRPVVSSPARRSLLISATRAGLPLLMSGGVIGVAAESYFRNEKLERTAVEPTAISPFMPPLDRQSFGSGLVRTPVTPVSQFYGMSKNAIDPVIDASAWRLTISVDGKPVRRFRYADLFSMQRQSRYITLRCISNTLKSDLMGTAAWTGVVLSQLIDRRTLPSNIIEAAFIGVEGHDDSLNLDYAFSDECLLALGMNGKTLSRTHGFPLRLLAPRYYGCRNVKWIGQIDFTSKPHNGTWQRLGYTREPVINIASHIDHLRRDGPLLQLGGVSFAGSRGIRAVRVRANAGSWQPATLETPLSPYTWTRWIAQVSAPDGSEIEANAQDGEGAWQELKAANPFPNGPAGPTIVLARV